jgi:hypothetical protein
MPITIERHVDTVAVLDILRGTNGEITYRDLARRAGLTDKRTKTVLGSARRMLANEGVLFGCIWGEGLKRLTDQDKVRKPEAFKRRVAKGAARELKHLGTIQHHDKLSKDEQARVTVNRTILGVLQTQARVKAEEIKVAPTPVPQPPPLIHTGRLIATRRGRS